MTNTITPTIADHDAGIATRVAAFEKDVVIGGDGVRAWAVISLDGSHRFHDPAPCVIYSALDTREAAEVARWSALLDLADPGRNGQVELPLSYFNSAGRVLRTLRCEGVTADDMIALAARLVDAAACETPRRKPGDDHPWADADDAPF